ncbi:MATH domain and coiled-coil domain-containing protein At3g58270-like [Herrania umbratica]|uniref:MATH domain and coiled-coil domain-containing protein At3g58270-like n=1 Tax=Herrania umbratica TaxID=108875 RepID=A0A6J0ZKF5_9ROSI|nr:MATH domain and coiled-coil domain-containing protein At3g58270-like [Herrania umbratica]
MNMLKMANEALEPGMQQLQHDFLDQDVQDHHVRNLESNNIATDYELFKNLENLEDFTNYPDPLWSQTIGCSFGLGTSIAETKLSPLNETVNVEGFRVLKENSPMIQQIFREYPNIASGLRVHYLASRNGFMNTLAEVFKMATMEREKCNLEDVKLMENGIKDLEFAGLDIPWLKDLVAESREKVEVKEEIKSTKAKLKLLEERESKLDSKRQRVSSP